MRGGQSGTPTSGYLSVNVLTRVVAMDVGKYGRNDKCISESKERRELFTDCDL